MHPRYGVEKEYQVTLEEPLKSEEAHKLIKGIIVDNRKVKLKKVSTKKNVVTLRIHEGRKHIVRRLFAKLDLHVVKLVRTKMGTLELGNLRSGKYRSLKRDELLTLFNLVNNVARSAN